MKQLLYIIALITFISCGGAKKATTTENLEDITSKRLVKEYYNNTLEYNTLDARTKIRYRDKTGTKPTVTLTIRIEKNQQIWINASFLGFSAARALITPEKVQFYDKLSTQYFDGDFEFLSQYLGVAIDFYQLQRLLTGQTVYDLREGKYTFKETNSGYEVTPRNQLEGINLFFGIGTQNFVTQEQRIEQLDESGSLDIAYSDFKQVGGKPFPHLLDILADDGRDQSQVQIEFRDIELNGELRMPFSIPSGYKEIELDAKK